MKTLKTTLRYKNPELIRRIQRTQKIDGRKAAMVYRDVLRWLWLCGRLRQEQRSNRWLDQQLPSMRMPESWLPVDIGWHEFILCTRSYKEFCDVYLDGYVHHKPAPVNEKLQSEGEAFERGYLAIFFTFCGNHIGYRRLSTWVDCYTPWSEELNRSQRA